MCSSGFFASSEKDTRLDKVPGVVVASESVVGASDTLCSSSQGVRPGMPSALAARLTARRADLLRSLRGRAQLKLSHAFHVVAQKISSNHKSPQSPTISSYKNQISSNIFKNYSIRLQKFYLLRSRCKAANLGGALFLRLGFRRLVLRPDGVDRAHIVALFTRGALGDHKSQRKVGGCHQPDRRREQLQGD